MAVVVRVCRAFLIAAITAWVAFAPLAWVLRDGLGPDAIDSTGAHAAGKFGIGWGLPALALGVASAGLRLLGRRLRGTKPARDA